MKKFLLLAFCLFLAGQVHAGKVTMVPVATETGLAYNNTYTLDCALYGCDQVAMQVLYTSATFQPATFTDGQKSTASITVVSTQPLVAIQGSDTVTVQSTNNITGALLLLNGRGYPNTGWRVDFASNTAVDIASQLGGITGFTASTTAATVVTVKCASSGTFCNSNTMSVVGTSSISVGTANFINGQDAAFIAINGIKCQQGPVQGPGTWTIGTSSITTAVNISSCILNTPALSAIVTSTDNGKGVITSTSTAAGGSTNYSLFSSTPAAMSIFANQYFGGSDSNVNTSLNSLTINNNGFTKALPVLFTVTAGTAPGLLVDKTTYYVMPLLIGSTPVVDPNTFKLSKTSTAAIAGIADASVSTQTVLGGGSFKLTASTLTGTPSFKLQVSNDNTNWADYTLTPSSITLSSVTVNSYTFGGALQMWDLGTFDWAYLRVNVIAPTFGGLQFVATAAAKQVSPYRF